MSALPPPTGNRVLVYGKDSILLHTRQRILQANNFQVDTVSDFNQLCVYVDQADPDYDLIIVCHTVPHQERDKIQHLIQRRSTGLYQLERMETPPRLLGTASEIISNKGNSAAGNSQTRSLLSLFVTAAYSKHW